MSHDDHGRDPFARAYAHLRERLDAGGYRAGERINIHALREELRLSQTPIREALSRLVGQNLIRATRGGGYHVPILDSRSTAQLYALYRLQLEAALREIRCSGEKAARRLMHDSSDVRPISRVANLFHNIFVVARNRPLSDAAHLVDLRLRPLRLHEPSLFADLEAECVSLETIARVGDRKHLRPAIRRFHRRRERSAARLAALLSGNGGHDIIG